jgi:hypothetical protein
MWRSVAVILTTVAFLGAGLGLSATTASARSIPNPNDQAHLLGFRLPAADGHEVFPNKVNYAQHAATPGRSQDSRHGGL